MSEISQKVLAERLTAGGVKVAVGTTYKHYKDRLYTVVAIALNEETLEPCVIYQAQYGEKLTWIRPVSDWLVEIEWEGKLVPRFTQV
jgi:hypothetical protein